MVAAKKKRGAPPSAAAFDLHDELGEALRAELATWPGVSLRKMMGTLSFFRGKQMLGCYVHRALFQKAPPKWAPRAGEPPFVWVRLREADKARALRRANVSQSRIAMKNWLEVSLTDRAALGEAVYWLGRAYESPLAAGKTKKKAR